MYFLRFQEPNKDKKLKAEVDVRIDSIMSLEGGEEPPVPTEYCPKDGWEGWSGNYEHGFDRLFPKVADAFPPLGYPGGPCYTMQRIHDNVKNPKLVEDLVDKIEEGQELSNSESYKIYGDPEVEKGPHKIMETIVISSHAQYRMDQRGVTVTEVRLALVEFIKAFHDGKSKGSLEFRKWSEDMSWGEPIKWTSRIPDGLTVVFQVKNKSAHVITTYWKGYQDPRPVSEESCGYPSAGRVAGLYLRKLSSSIIPGVKTFVTPESELGLPTDVDIERQQALPLPGSATPGGAGRDIPKFEYNTPGVEPRINPRTLGVPGEEYGHPVKFDYGMPTRRVLGDQGYKHRVNESRDNREVKTAGDVILYDQDNPSNRETNQPGPDVSYRAEGPFTYVHSPDEQSGVPSGSLVLNRDYTNTPPASGRVIPDGMQDEDTGFPAGHKYAALISEVMAKCGPDIVSNSSGVKYKRLRINPKDAIITYSVDGSKGETYKVWVKGLRKGNVKTLSKMQIQVACTCNFFRWSGPEHWAKSNSFLYGKPAGTASKPEVRDPKGQNWLCKHVYAILRDHQGAKFASVSGPTRQDTESLLESGVFPDSLLKTAKVLLSGGGSSINLPDQECSTVPHTLTASDRSSLIRLASSLPVGSPERKAILAGLKVLEKEERSSIKKKAKSLADLPDAPMGYEWKDVSDEWGDTAFTLYSHGDEVGSVVDQGRNWVTYVAGEEWPIGRGQSNIWDAGFQLLDHIGLA
jgi:hypothetical protein